MRAAGAASRPARGGRGAHPRARRILGRPDPGALAERGGLPRRALRRAPLVAARRHRRAVPDRARGRRGLAAEYLEAGADILTTNTFTATTIAQADYDMQATSPRSTSTGARLSREARGPLRGRRSRGAALGRRLDRADQPDALALARRRGSGRARGRLRRGLRRLPPAGARAARGRRRHLPGRDDLRHAQRQGGVEGDPGPARRGPRGPADLDLGHDHRPLGPHAVGTDRRGVLDLGAPRRAVRGRA